MTAMWTKLKRPGRSSYWKTSKTFKNLHAHRSKKVARVSAKGWKGNATTFDTYRRRNLDSTKASEKFTDGTEKYLSSQIKSCLSNIVFC